ncbi:MAG: aminotransferase class I/II-fold pyridoxal phosphate-dependent enzyme [Acidimicrobiales bacterium]
MERASVASAAVRAADQWREIRTLGGPGVRTTLPDGRAVLQFASNDYLGLAHHPAVVAAAVEATGEYGVGSGASRLVVGSRPPHDRLESALAEWKHAEAALLFPTGYAANVGVLMALARLGVRRASPSPS